MSDKISVIVPVYNSINCLERCVKSICAQTYEHLEILLIDDGSTDGTDRLCERLASEDDRIRTHHKKNGEHLQREMWESGCPQGSIWVLWTVMTISSRICMG